MALCEVEVLCEKKDWESCLCDEGNARTGRGSAHGSAVSRLFSPLMKLAIAGIPTWKHIDETTAHR